MPVNTGRSNILRDVLREASHRATSINWKEICKSAMESHDPNILRLVLREAAAVDWTDMIKMATDTSDAEVVYGEIHRRQMKPVFMMMAIVAFCLIVSFRV
jgi:hypothetical protein